MLNATLVGQALGRALGLRRALSPPRAAVHCAGGPAEPRPEEAVSFSFLPVPNRVRQADLVPVPRFLVELQHNRALAFAVRLAAQTVVQNCQLHMHILEIR